MEVMNKLKYSLIFLGILLLSNTLTLAAEKLNPYQDYIIVILHGINDHKKTFDGTSEEMANDPEKKERLNLKKHLALDMGLSEETGYVQVYSYSNNRGSNLQNAVELGYRGIQLPIKGKTPQRGHRLNDILRTDSYDKNSFKNFFHDNPGVLFGGAIGLGVGIGLENYNLKKDWNNLDKYIGMLGYTAFGAIAMNNVDKMLTQGLFASSDLFGFPREIYGEAEPYEAFNRNLKNPDLNRNEIFTYLASLDRFYASGVQYGNCFLEQARIDFKEWWRKKENAALFYEKYKDISEVPDSVAPKKFILISHSMGNLSARLYIYSNELAKQGKFFQKGFYQDDVAKLVMIAPPAEGSDIAYGAVASPLIKNASAFGEIKGLVNGAMAAYALYNAAGGGLDGIKMLLSDALAGESMKYIIMFDKLQDPWLTPQNPAWPIELSNDLRDKAFTLSDWGKKTDPGVIINERFGIRGEPRVFNIASWDLMPNSDVVNTLKNVQKPAGAQEPSYGILYSRGVPGIDFVGSIPGIAVLGVNALGNDMLKNINISINNSHLTDINFGTYSILMNGKYNSLPNSTAKFMSWDNYFRTGKGLLTFVSDGDFAVPAWSAQAQHTPSLANAKREEVIVKVDQIEGLMDQLPVEIASSEALSWIVYYFVLFSPGSTPQSAQAALKMMLLYTRLAILSDLSYKYTQSLPEIAKYMNAHNELIGEREKIVKLLMDEPASMLKDTDILKAQNTTGNAWSGIYAVTQNVTSNAKFQTQVANKTYYLTKLTSQDLTRQDVSGNATASDNTSTDTQTIELELDGNSKRISTICLSSDKIMLRGVIKDLLPKKLIESTYSYNFSGWTDFSARIEDDGRFEIGPLDLAEGQNLISIKLKNMVGYESLQQLKILKTSISVQPLLDNLVPTIDSYINKRDIKLHLAYQNMKHSADIATKIWLDELKVFKAASNGIASPAARNDRVTANATVTTNAEPVLIVNLKNTTGAPNGIQADRYSEKLIPAPNNADHLNRLEADYNFTVTQDGKYMVQAKAVDEYGTSSFLRYEFTVDTTPPTIEFIIKPRKKASAW